MVTGSLPRQNVSITNSTKALQHSLYPQTYKYRDSGAPLVGIGSGFYPDIFVAN